MNYYIVIDKNIIVLLNSYSFCYHFIVIINLSNVIIFFLSYLIKNYIYFLSFYIVFIFKSFNK